MKITLKASSFIASAKEVTISRSDFDISRVLAIINQTKGILIYSTASEALKYTSYDLLSRKVVVSYDTTAMSNSDVIQVVYEAEDAPAVSLAEVVTKVVPTSGGEGLGGSTEFSAPAGCRTMQIFCNAGPVNSAPMRWTAPWETPSATNGAMMIPTSVSPILPAVSISAIGVEGTADVTIVYYN